MVTKKVHKKASFDTINDLNKEVIIGAQRFFTHPFLVWFRSEKFSFNEDSHTMHSLIYSQSLHKIDDIIYGMSKCQPNFLIIKKPCAPIIFKFYGI